MAVNDAVAAYERGDIDEEAMLDAVVGAATSAVDEGLGLLNQARSLSDKPEITIDQIEAEYPTTRDPFPWEM